MLQENLFTPPESEPPPSSARAFRANPSQLQASVRELVTAVTSGPRLPGCFARLNPDGSWVRTSEGSLASLMDECSEPFSETWPTWGIASDGVATVLTKPQEQVTAEIGCSLSPTLEDWRTPSAGDQEGGIMEIRPGANGKYKLRDQSAAWPTHCANQTSDYTNRASDLRNASAAWPTARSNCSHGPGMHGQGGLDLQTAATTWMTPHGMAGVDYSGKPGAGGEFAKQATSWATPRSGQSAGSSGVEWEPGKKPTKNGKPITTSITDQAQNWATPRANTLEGRGTSTRKPGTGGKILNEEAAQWHSHPAPPITTHGQASCENAPTLPPPSPVKKRLNFKFVEWLMGFPEGWL